MVARGRPGAAPAVQIRFDRWRRDQAGVLFVLPTVLVMAAVIGYPVFYTVRLSFAQVQLGQDALPFIGLKNYSDVLADRVFATVIRNTLIWTFTSVGLVTGLGLLAALLVNERFPGRTAVRSLLLVPWIIPGIVAAVTWKWLYHPDFGIVNDMLLRLGLISRSTNWLADPTWALYAVIAVNVWKGFPFAMLMLLAGLQSAPQELYHAARADGANAWERLRYVTLPHLRPILVVVALLLTIWNLNTFTYVYVLTGGGPIRLSEVVGVYIYNLAFTSFRFGMASAAAVVVFAISAVLTLVYVQALRATERAEG